MSFSRGSVQPYQSGRNDSLASLIKAIAGGDHDAVTALYDLTSPLLYGLAWRILGDAAAAAEVLLDVYVQVWRQAARYDEKRGKPWAWLITITRTRALDRLRSDRKERQRTEPIEEVANQHATKKSPEEAAAGLEIQRYVSSAMDTLPREQQQVIELVYYEEMSYSEVAALLGQPLGTVKTRMRLGMKKLHRFLAPILETN